MRHSDTDWHGLYKNGWKGEIVPDAFSHPAKFSRLLIRHIYQHMIDEGWLQPGNVVVDPFGGVALGALDAMKHGLNWIGVELELAFIDSGFGCECTGFTKADWRRYQDRFGRIRYRDGRHICPECMGKVKPKPKDRKIPCSEPHHYTGNIELWNARYSVMPNWGSARLLQGDSRRLLEVIAEAGACVSSPPWGDNLANDGRGSDDLKIVRQIEEKYHRQYTDRSFQPTDYGSTPGNLGNMRATAAGLSAAVSSPPYADGAQHTGGNDPHPEHIEGGKLHLPGLAGAVSSPPYAETAIEKNSTGINIEKQWQTYRKQGGGMSLDAFRAQQERHSHDYGSSVGQLGAMPARGFDAACSSPPFLDNNVNIGAVGDTPGMRQEIGGNKREASYGITPGNLGNITNDDFWTSARLIVDQVYAALAPGAHAVWVVKAFVKNKTRVDFPGQWRQMCEAAGFVTVHEHRAWLVEHRGAQYDLDGELVEKKVERKSFFRRLAESKGSPRIDYEIVLCMQKSEDT